MPQVQHDTSCLPSQQSRPTDHVDSQRRQQLALEPTRSYKAPGPAQPQARVSSSARRTAGPVPQSRPSSQRGGRTAAFLSGIARFPELEYEASPASRMVEQGICSSHVTSPSSSSQTRRSSSFSGHVTGCRCRQCQPQLYDSEGRLIKEWYHPCVDGCHCRHCLRGGRRRVVLVS